MSYKQININHTMVNKLIILNLNYLYHVPS
jgi:hypothetical protein